MRKKHFLNKSVKQQRATEITHRHMCFSHSLFSQGLLILKTLMHNQRKMLTVLQTSPFTYNKINRRDMQKTVLLLSYSTPVVKFIQKYLGRNSFLIKLQAYRLQRYKKINSFTSFFSRTLTTEEGQLICRNTSVWLLPLQTDTQKKTSNSARLTSKNG